MKRAIQMALLSSCAGLGLGGAATLETEAALRPLSIEALAARSDVVVIGRVSGVESRWTEWEGIGRLIVTRCTLTVEEVLGGEARPEERLAVEIPGGTVGDLTLVVSDAPALVPGERAVFFLRDAGDAHRVYGLERGRIALDGDRVAARASEDPDPLPTLDEIRRAAKASARPR